MEINVATLVELVASRAIVDKTTPDATNLRNGWRTDALLVDIDAFVVIKCNDPATYAEIGRQVLARVGDLPEMAILAQLAVFRGERLLELNQEREQSLVQMAQDLDTAVASLPESTRKMRCASLLKYHEGIFFGACGRFDLAAKLHCQSAKEAERLGDKAEAAIAYFCEASDLLKYALLKGEPNELQERFSALEQKLNQMSEALSGSVFQVQWAEGNGPAQMLEACVWLGQFHPYWDNWLQSTLSASEKLGEACRPGAEFSKALDTARRKEPNAYNLLHDAATKSDIPERKATAFLVMAHLLLLEGRRQEAETLVASMPETGAQHVRAIAQRMLA